MGVSYVKVVGLDRVKDNLGRLTRTVNEAPHHILLEEAPRIEAEAKLETPVDTGDLRNSVRAEVTRKARTRSSLTLSASSVHNGYDYAKIQHDNESYNHPRGGKAHYLRDPFVRGVERIESRMKSEVRYDK